MGSVQGWPGRSVEAAFSLEEVQLAARNHGMPLEMLRHGITPVGMHYLLIHYDIPLVHPGSWRLHVDGAVANPASYSLDDLQALDHVTRPVTMECAGNGRARLDPRVVSQPWVHEAVGTGEWTGALLWPLLQEAGIEGDAVEVVFHGLDRGREDGVEQTYARSLTLDDARRPAVMLAWGLNGGPLPPQHGYPLRLVVPGWYGMASVKWLDRITVVTEPFEGFQQTQVYRFRTADDDPGVPLQRIAPRALLVPPGIPDFFTRERYVEPGRCLIEGRAWSGHGAIVRVEVSADGGATWVDADLDPPTFAYAWQAWSHLWDAEPGEHVLCCRATDEAGNVQPVEQPWNTGGYAVNDVQRVPVIVA
jgi:DMSO/TMAO reductase YedYZ molybdopterin-dependent catalytic subunit